ncbi:MAG: phenylalanine 4-monooxygenase [Pseudomonadota bacterium]
MSKYVAKKPDSAGHIHFTDQENETWQILYERQIEVVRPRACQEYLDGITALDLPHDHIPQCDEISEVLTAKTGWSVVPVDAVIPLESFFSLLANRQFPAATFIRLREDLDYLQEPDIFHEYFGHCPLLTHQAYADFIQWYGEIALTTNKKAQSLLGRLFWFTIEFGLLQTAKGLKIYGGGILSSFSETHYALESQEPQRIAFDIEKILHTPYRYDVIQNKYFVIDDMNTLFHIKSDKIIQLVENIIEAPQAENFVVC